MRGTIITRFLSQDYTAFLDKDLFVSHRETLGATGLGRACEETRPGLIFWHGGKIGGAPGNFLKVTGIPSERRDKVNTPIRYSIIMEGHKEELEPWAVFFLSLFEKKNTESLKATGKCLDELIVDNASLDEKATPDFASVLKKLDDTKARLNAGSKTSEKPESGYIIFSPLLGKTEYLTEVLTDSLTCAGTHWLDGEYLEVKRPAQKKTLESRVTKEDPKMVKMLMGAVLLMVIILLGETTYLISLSGKVQNLESSVQQLNQCQENSYAVWERLSELETFQKNLQSQILNTQKKNTATPSQESPLSNRQANSQGEQGQSNQAPATEQPAMNQPETQEPKPEQTPAKRKKHK